MVTVRLRFEDDMKKKPDSVCDETGMNLTAFFMAYAKKVLRDREIPFEIEAPDPFCSEANMRNIEKSLRQIREGKAVVKTTEEPEAMEDE